MDPNNTDNPIVDQNNPQSQVPQDGSPPLEDSQQDTPAGPGLDFQPSAPSGLEGSFELPSVPAAQPESQPAVEAAPSAPEVQAPIETQPVPETYVAPEIPSVAPPPVQQQQPQVQEPPQPAVQQQQESVQEHVVDKRTHHERLKAVSETADATTSDADKEEEEFIEGVEHAHEH